MDTLKDFVKREMRLRDIKSARAFAELVGVTHTTINNIIDEREDAKDYQPSIDVLVKLATATGHDLISILRIVLPDVQFGDFGDPESKILAKQIEQLSEDKRSLVKAFIAGSDLARR